MTGKTVEAQARPDPMPLAEQRPGPPFFAILVCTTVAARRRMTSSSEWSVETDSSAMIGMLVARQSAARPSRSQIAIGCSATSMSWGSSFFRSASAAS